MTFKSNKKSYLDGGIMLKLSDGRALFSGYLCDDNSTKFENNRIIVEGFLAFSKIKLLTPLNNVLLRCFQMSLGRISIVSSFIKEKLRDKLITGAKISGNRFKRELILEENHIRVNDWMSAGDKDGVFINGAEGASIYVPSSRYFSNSKLFSVPLKKNFDKKQVRISKNIYCGRIQEI